jgi:hypothetical protein
MCGDAAGALRDAESIAATTRELALDRTTLVAAERVRALAESGVQDHDAARASIERALALAGELEYGGLPLAVLHEARARIALAAGNAQECAAALVLLHGLLEHADAPALINAYEALRAGSMQLAMPQLAAPGGAHGQAARDVTEEIASHVRTRLSAHDDRDERALQALELLLEDSGADTGHLFLFDETGLFAAASINGDAHTEELLSLARRHVDGELTRAGTEAVTVAMPSMHATMPTPLGTAEYPLTPVLLSDESNGVVLTGIALLAMRGEPAKPPRSQLVRAISRCLQTAGDSVPRALEG